MVEHYYEFGHKTEQGFLRNRYGTAAEIGRWAREAGNGDVYASVFAYGDRSPSGPLWAGLYLDLDHPDRLPAYEDLHTLLVVLSRLGARERDYTVAFSGNKGFHLCLRAAAMGVEPAADLPRVFRRLAEGLNRVLPQQTIDLKVYERRRLWRLVNSRHGESGLYKVLLPRPLPGLPAILDYARRTHPIIARERVNANGALVAWLERARQELAKEAPSHPHRSGVGDRQVSAHVEHLLEGVAEGQRNNTAFYLACYLTAKGFSPEEVRERVGEFGARCTPPMDRCSLARTVESALQHRRQERGRGIG